MTQLSCSPPEDGIDTSAGGVRNFKQRVPAGDVSMRERARAGLAPPCRRLIEDQTFGYGQVLGDLQRGCFYYRRVFACAARRRVNTGERGTRIRRRVEEGMSDDVNEVLLRRSLGPRSERRSPHSPCLDECAPSPPHNSLHGPGLCASLESRTRLYPGFLPRKHTRAPHARRRPPQTSSAVHTCHRPHCYFRLPVGIALC